MDVITLINSLWVVVSAALVFFMQPGFSMVESGMTREKNSINVAIKNLTDLGLSSIMYWIVGFAFMFGTSKLGVIGFSDFMPNFGSTTEGGVMALGGISSPAFSLALFFLFQTMFCSTSATIVSGAVAERMRYSSYIFVSLVVSAFIYPIFGHWVWNSEGWLAQIGFIDFAGSTVVHSVGGYVGLAGIIIMGARKGRFSPDGTSNEIQGSNVPMAVVGVFILWFGWLGFNGGSGLAFEAGVPLILINTCLAAAAGLVGALAIGWFFTKIPNVNFVLNGSLAGLVAITAGCHCVTPAESIIIGFIGGVVMLLCTWLLDKLKLDDAVGAIPVHLAAGIWGTLAVGIFGDATILGTTPIAGSQFLAQLIGVAACAAWTFGVSFVVLKIYNNLHGLRVTEAEEDEGLNIAEHGASTVIYDLYNTMEEQAATGDLSLRLPVEPFTEIGQIATLYNKVMEGLESNTVAKAEYTEILDNVSEGLLLITKDFVICPNYSSISKRLLHCSELEGRNFLTLMAKLLSERDTKALREFLPILFNPVYKDATIANLNPLVNAEITILGRSPEAAFTAIEKRKLHFAFSRIYDKRKTKILHVMVIIKREQVQ